MSYLHRYARRDDISQSPLHIIENRKNEKYNTFSNNSSFSFLF